MLCCRLKYVASVSVISLAIGICKIHGKSRAFVVKDCGKRLQL